MATTAAQKLVRSGHQLELLEQAKKLCDDQEYVDLTIYCEDGVVHAHQMLLATASPFLKLLFQSSPLYGTDDISLILPEVKVCLVQALVHFVYTGTVVSKEDHFYSLMKLVYALNMNASIEAESTNEKPTSFAPATPKRATKMPQFTLPSQPLAMSQLPQLPTQPVPRISAVGAPNLPALGANGKGIQLPTQPVPLSGVVNGVSKPDGGGQVQTIAGGMYIAVDASTGLSYKLEMPAAGQGQAAATASTTPAAAEVSDPLAAIMNETIFTDTSAVYPNTENGQMAFGASGSSSSASSTPHVSTVASKGKKRKGVGGVSGAAGKEPKIMTDSIDDVPCTPDDEDINTPYPCEHCNRSIKGRVMLQAHHYQEHYDNPALAAMDIGDKHVCRVCLKLFTRNSDVKAHILRVHCGDRRYPCTM